MSVVQSKDFTWAPGMKTVCGSRFFGHTGLGSSKTEWWINPDGELRETDDYMNKCFEPDLEDGPTQGAIIFGIFEPLQISIVAGRNGFLPYMVGVHTFGGGGLPDMISSIGVLDHRPDAIRAVFAALDSEAGR